MIFPFASMKVSAGGGEYVRLPVCICVRSADQLFHRDLHAALLDPAEVQGDLSGQIGELGQILAPQAGIGQYAGDQCLRLGQIERSSGSTENLDGKLVILDRVVLAVAAAEIGAGAIGLTAIEVQQRCEQRRPARPEPCRWLQCNP